MSGCRTLVVYSSRRTGNTEKVARAIHSALSPECDIYAVSDAPDPADYDFVILGFGIYRGWPDDIMKTYMKRCSGIDVGIFITLGAWPDCEHAFVCTGRAEGLLDSCRVRATYVCHGRLDPEMVKRMKERPAGSPHSWDEERAKRVEAAESHPDENDLLKASAIFMNARNKLRSPDCQ